MSNEYGYVDKDTGEIITNSSKSPDARLHQEYDGAYRKSFWNRFDFLNFLREVREDWEYEKENQED